MSEMVERVAKAIYEKRNGQGCRPWSRQPSAHKFPYIEDARAAIEAMREPTEAMLTAGDDCCGEYGCGVWRMREIFTAQIDAALKD